VNNKIFRAMNVALIIGGLSLVLAFIYLITNLNRADEIVFYCLPGFIFGLVLIILYGIRYQKLNKIKIQTKFEKSISLWKIVIIFV